MENKILDKIKKLMRHKESAEAIGSTAEAEVFAVKIQKLLNEYNLSLSDISLEERQDNITKTKEDAKSPGFKGRSSYRVMKVVAKFNWCKVYCSSKSTDNYMILVGSPENIEVCKYIHSVVFNVAVKEGRKSYSKYKKEFEENVIKRALFNKPISRGAYLRTFIEGFSSGLYDKFEAEQNQFKKENTNAGAIIVANEGLILSFVEKSLGKIQTKKQKGGIGENTNASNLGYSAGRNVQITKGIETESKPVDVKFIG